MSHTTFMRKHQWAVGEVCLAVELGSNRMDQAGPPPAQLPVAVQTAVLEEGVPGRVASVA